MSLGVHQNVISKPMPKHRTKSARLTTSPSWTPGWLDSLEASFAPHRKQYYSYNVHIRLWTRLLGTNLGKVIALGRSSIMIRAGGELQEPKPPVMTECGNASLAV